MPDQQRQHLLVEHEVGVGLHLLELGELVEEIVLDMDVALQHGVEVVLDVLDGGIVDPVAVEDRDHLHGGTSLYCFQYIADRRVSAINFQYLVGMELA